MKRRIKEQLNKAKKLTSPVEVNEVAMALMRIVLQHACISIAEELIQIRRISLDTTPRTPLPLAELREPSDGDLAATLGQLLILAENEGWSGIGRGFWEQKVEDRPCSRLSLGKKTSAEKVLSGFIAKRNDTDHGIPGNMTEML